MQLSRPQDLLRWPARILISYQGNRQGYNRPSFPLCLGFDLNKDEMKAATHITVSLLFSLDAAM